MQFSLDQGRSRWLLFTSLALCVSGKPQQGYQQFPYYNAAPYADSQVTPSSYYSSQQAYQYNQYQQPSWYYPNSYGSSVRLSPYTNFYSSSLPQMNMYGQTPYVQQQQQQLATGYYYAPTHGFLYLQPSGFSQQQASYSPSYAPQQQAHQQAEQVAFRDDAESSQIPSAVPAKPVLVKDPEILAVVVADPNRVPVPQDVQQQLQQSQPSVPPAAFFPFPPLEFPQLTPPAAPGTPAITDLDQVVPPVQQNQLTQENQPVRQNQWFYGLNFPTPAQVIAAPITGLFDGSLFAQLLPPTPTPAEGGNSSSPSINATDVESTIYESSGTSTTIPPLIAQNSPINEFLAGAINNLFGPGTRGSEAVSDQTDEHQQVATFRGAAPLRAKATLSISGGNGVGEAFFYQPSSTDDVAVIVVVATDVAAGAKDVLVTSDTITAACTPRTATAYNPAGVGNGGFIAQAFGLATAQNLNLINKKVSNSAISLYSPNSIIGKTLLVRTTANSVVCGEIVSVS